MAKRSLASKYLHFHCPHMFYIYDSRANTKSMSIIKMDLQDARKLDACDFDKEYAHFCVRMLELQTFAFKKFNRVLTPRELDNFLLYA